MRFPGFIGPSYQMRSINVDCQRCVNLYPEVDELGTEKEHEVASLVGTPGLTLLETLGIGPIRGTYTSTTGTFYVVSGNTLYDVFPFNGSWTSITVGTLATSIGPVSMADNSVDLFVVDGTNGYYSTLGSNSLTQTTDANWAGATQVLCADGMFVFLKPNSNQFYISNVLSTVINPIGFSTNNSLQTIVAIAWVNRNLWLLNEQTSEVWYDSGSGFGGTTGSPFQIIQGGVSQVGTAASFSVNQMANSLFWVGRDQNGWGSVYTANGYQPQRISTYPVEFAINSYGDISTATSYCYQESGHNFYCLNFPNANTTWVFDQATGMWHERVYLNNGAFERHRAQCHAFAYETSVVGDYQNGNLYAMSSSVYTDNGNPIVRQRISPHLAEDMKRVFYSSFQLDLEPGVGLDGTGQGTNPQAILQYSNDGGHTWSNERWAGVGAIGSLKARAKWDRLGLARDRVYKVTITDPVKVVLIGAELELQEGAA